MTKSNVRAVRRRKTNERIARQYDKVEQDRVRAYQERNIQMREAHSAKRKDSFFRKVFYRLRAAFSSLYRRLRARGRSISSLDLRDGGLLGRDVKRDAGAQKLRGWFGQDLKMVSTRDGRRV